MLDGLCDSGGDSPTLETGNTQPITSATIWRWIRVHAERLVQQWGSVLHM